MSSGKSFSQSSLEFLVENAIYPMWSKKGKVYFRAKKGVLVQEKKRELVEELNLRTKADKLPLSKLLAIILRTGKEGMSAEELAKRLLNHFESLSELDSVPISELCKIEGIGMVKAVQIKAAFELGKRLFRESAEERKRIGSPDDAIEFVSEYYGPYLKDAKKEFFQVILLDIKNKPIDKIELSKGSIDATVVDPKEIVKEATLRSASAVILVHNHPSGDTTPSSDDITLTRKIIEACNLVGVKVLDHIIIGKTKEKYFSFAKEGLLSRCFWKCSIRISPILLSVFSAPATNVEGIKGLIY
jgi:DNA repair protein RadC